MPKAPSKIYYVPERKHVPEEDKVTMEKLFTNYRTSMKSLKRHLRRDWETQQRSRAQPGHVVSPEQEEAEHRQLMEFNRAENARMAAERHNRLAEQEETVRRKVERLRIEAEQKQQRDRENAVQLIRTQEEISKLYIPREQLEEAIEVALANEETDYNFAIDRDGMRYEGRSTRPQPAA